MTLNFAKLKSNEITQMLKNIDLPIRCVCDLNENLNQHAHCFFNLLKFNLILDDCRQQ